MGHEGFETFGCEAGGLFGSLGVGVVYVAGGREVYEGERRVRPFREEGGETGVCGEVIFRKAELAQSSATIVDRFEDAVIGVFEIFKTQGPKFGATGLDQGDDLWGWYGQSKT